MKIVLDYVNNSCSVFSLWAHFSPSLDPLFG